MSYKPYTVKTMQDVGEVICFDGVPIQFDQVIDYLNQYRKALKAISINSCCGDCLEAKKVALVALGNTVFDRPIRTRNAAGNLLL